MSGKIFISYRRDDDPAFAARIRDALVQRFGRGSVFMDVDSLLAGTKFDDELAAALVACDVFIAVLGASWLELLEQKAAGKTRDYVQDEIAAALKRGIPVIPVRVGREGQLASIPLPEELPPAIRDLAHYQKHDIAHEQFGRDVAALAAAVQTLRTRQRNGSHTTGRLALRVGAIALVAAVSGYAAYWSLLGKTKGDIAAIESKSEGAPKREAAIAAKSGEPDPRAKAQSEAEAELARKEAAEEETARKKAELEAAAAAAAAIKAEQEKQAKAAAEAKQREDAELALKRSEAAAAARRAEEEAMTTPERLGPARPASQAKALWSQCQTGDTQSRVAACSGIIDSRAWGDVPKLADAYDERCRANRDLGLNDKGIRDCLRSIQLRPNYPYSYNNLGSLYLILEKYVDAVGVLDKSVSLKPNFFYSRLNRAKALIALGQLDSARADLQMAISLQRNDAEAAELLRRVDSASSASVGR
jgi:hypothetical protein